MALKDHPGRILSERYSEAVKIWSLEQPDKAISALLRWDGSKTSLQMDSLFEPRLPLAGLPGRTSFEALHGRTKNGRDLTLLECNLTQVLTNFSARFTQHGELEADLLLLGAHVTASTKFKRVSICVPGLHIWLARATVATKYIPRTGSGGLGFSFTVEGLEKEVIRVESISSDVTFRVGIQQDHDDWTIELKSLGHIDIDPDEPQLLDWYINKIVKLTNLLALMAATPMPSSSFSVITEDDVSADLLIRFDGSSYCSYLKIDNFFMCRADLAEHLEPVVNKWFSLNPQLAVASDLAVGAIFANDLAPSVNLLLLLQGLESLHRGVSPGQYMDPEEFKLVVSALNCAIPSQVSENHRASLKSRIRFANQMSLRNRLKELGKSVGDEILFRLVGDQKKIFDSWTDTRNYFTHWDEGTKVNVLESRDLDRAIVKIRAFLRVLYLLGLGIPHEKINTCLQNGSLASQCLIRTLNFEFEKNK